MRKLDFAVGLFLIAGLLSLGYLSVTFGNVNLFTSDKYRVEAVFSDVSGLKVNTNVEMLGVKIGNVSDIKLKDYQVKVTLSIDRDVDLPEPGTSASIVTEGLLGERYISISPGHGRDNIPKDGTGKISDTNPPLLIEDIVSRFIFGEEDNFDEQ